MDSITPKKKIYSDLPAKDKMADMAQFLKDHKAQNVLTIDRAGRGSEKKYEYLRMDGYTNGQWLLVDCNDVVVNIFQESTRELYNLEALWSVPSSREELRTMAEKAAQ